MVKITDAQKNYGDFHLNISLELPEGKVSGIVGRNGSGKSTTIKAILGLIKLDGGKIEVFERDSRTLSMADKQRIGVAFSNSGFSSYLNVGDIIKILRNSYDDFDEKFFRDFCKKK